MGFAFANSAPTRQGRDACITWLSASRSKQSCWLLVDAALLDRKSAVRLQSLYRDQLLSAYAGTPISGFGDSAPQLIECSEGAQERIVNELTDLAGDASAISAVRIPKYSPIRRMQQLSGYLARIQLEDRVEKIHCRFADTRVLPALLDVLDDMQLSPLSGSVLDWGWFNRRGQWVSRQIAKHEQVTPPETEIPSALKLQIGQFRAIQAASEADGIFHLLVEQTPEVVPKSDRGEFHEELVRILDKASTFTLSGTKDRMQFVMLSLTCGEDFHQHVRLAAMWADIIENGTTLREHMRSWDDGLWDELSTAGAR